MKRKIVNAVLLLVGFITLFNLSVMSNYHHRRAGNIDRLLHEFCLGLPEVADADSSDNYDRGASRWDCHEYWVTFDEEYSDRTIRKFERRCRSNTHWEKELDDYNNPIYVYRSEPEWQSDTYFYTCRFENGKCQIEYYIDEDEATFNVLIYGALLLLWLIVFGVISLVRTVNEKSLKHE